MAESPDPAPTESSGEPGSRQRILETALRLMARHGVHAMSMRRLSDECGLNVATLYHHFPSKADLLSEVIAYRSYPRLLAELPPVDPEAPVRQRLASILHYVFTEMADQDDMWRLLLGESLRGDQQVVSTAADLSAMFEAALNDWFAQLLADFPGDPAAAARVMRGSIYGFFVEVLPLPREDQLKVLSAQADLIARVLVPDPGAGLEPVPPQS